DRPKRGRSPRRRVGRSVVIRTESRRVATAGREIGVVAAVEKWRGHNIRAMPTLDAMSRTKSALYSPPQRLHGALAAGLPVTALTHRRRFIPWGCNWRRG